MSKEISEQPEVIKKCINEYLDKIRKEINIVNFPIDPKKISKVNLIACGTAYHACIVGKYWFEEFTDIDVNVDVASEYRYRNNKIKENELYIFVSQSGETADTIAALDFCKKEGANTCQLCNVAGFFYPQNNKCRNLLLMPDPRLALPLQKHLPHRLRFWY